MMNDEDVQRILAAYQAGESLESLQQRYPDHAAELQRLLGVVYVLQHTRHPEPPAQAKQAQTQFMRLAAQKRIAQKTPARASTRRPQRIKQGWKWAMAMVMIMVLSAGSVVSASAHSLPGEPLYGVKRWRERVEYSLSSADGRINEQLEQIQARNTELQAMLELGRPIPEPFIADVQTITTDTEQALLSSNIIDERWISLAQMADQQAGLLEQTALLDPGLNASIRTVSEDVADIRERAWDVVRDTPTLREAAPTAVPTPTLVVTSIPARTPTTSVTSTPILPAPTRTRTPMPTAEPTDAPTAEPTRTNPGNPNPGPPITPPGNPNPGPPTANPGNPNPGPPTANPGNPNPGPPTANPGNPNPGPPTANPGNPNPGQPTPTVKPGNPDPGPPATPPGNPNPGQPTDAPSEPTPTPKPGNPNPGPPATPPGNPDPGPPTEAPTNPALPTDAPPTPTTKPGNPNPGPPATPPGNPDPGPPATPPGNPDPGPPITPPGNPDPGPPDPKPTKTPRP